MSFKTLAGICLVDETVQEETDTNKSIAPGLTQAYELPTQDLDTESEVAVDTSESLEELMSKMKAM